MPFKRKYKNPASMEGGTFFEKVYEICFFLLFTGYFLFYENRILQVSFVGLGISGTLLLIASRLYLSSFKLPLNTVWYFLFFAFAELSALWAYSSENAAGAYLRLIVLLLALGMGITQYVTTTNDAEKLLKMFVYSMVIISVVQMIFTPIDQWDLGFFGSVVGGHNSNTFGFVASIASIVAFYFGYLKGLKHHYAFAALFIMCCLLTSSRKSLAICFFGIMLVVLLAFKKKHHFLHFGISVFIAAFIFLLIFADNTLYDIVGHRFESLFEFMSTGHANKDSSLLLREYFIEFAKILFMQKPLIGHGFANFAVLLAAEGDVGKEVYAHNNYWEILADLGIVGFVVYYWFHIYLFVKLIIMAYKERNNTLPTLGIAMLVSLLILEWGIVSMASFYPQVILSLIYVCSYASNSKRLYHYAPQIKKR